MAIHGFRWRLVKQGDEVLTLVAGALGQRFPEEVRLGLDDSLPQGMP